MIQSEAQQSVPNLVTSVNAPSGCIPLVEPYDAHLRFVENCPEGTVVLTRISDIEPFIRRGETASTLFPKKITVATTTTVNDEYLDELSWQREADLIHKFEPTFHIPCDIPVYEGTDRPERRERIEGYLDRTVAVALELAETDVELIPLLKGVNVEEWRIVRRIFDLLGVEYYAYYGTQYFLSGAGFGSLLEDLRSVVSEMPDRKIFLIGLLAPDLLERLPPQVVAASGLHQWRTWVNLREVPAIVSRSRYESLRTEVKSALSEGQTPIGIWTGTSQKEVV